MKRTNIKRKTLRRDVEPGYCQCGCGEWIGFWTGTDRRLGRIKGEPKRFACGHNNRVNLTITPESYRAEWESARPEIPYGRCWCGCGAETNPAKYTSMETMIVKGEPRRYVVGHTDRLRLRGFELYAADGETYAKIPLTQGYYALVDEDDATWLSQWNWYYWDGYARRNGEWHPVEDGRLARDPILMHRSILQLPDQMDVDHANGDGLDNRRLNIRPATRAQNMHNRGSVSGSEYKGVHWHKRRGKWAAAISVNGTRYHLGYFHSDVEAALSYDEAAVEHHGEFAHLNFPHAVESAGGIALANRRLSGRGE